MPKALDIEGCIGNAWKKLTASTSMPMVDMRIVSHTSSREGKIVAGLGSRVGCSFSAFGQHIRRPSSGVFFATVKTRISTMGAFLGTRPVIVDVATSAAWLG
ncbi:hypothetical protein DIPPA_34965 [Diplonema papillatum]|nr:hypothetical protein DIPPA_27798 [Diplonema papillatum]KAJ9472473.1 hypothetical protein DIPPA_34965 [Diplonema papillatum]